MVVIIIVERRRSRWRIDKNLKWQSKAREDCDDMNLYQETERSMTEELGGGVQC